MQDMCAGLWCGEGGDTDQGWRGPWDMYAESSLSLYLRVLSLPPVCGVGRGATRIRAGGASVHSDYSLHDHVLAIGIA